MNSQIPNPRCCTQRYYQVCHQHPRLKPEPQQGKFQSLTSHEDRKFIFRFQEIRPRTPPHTKKTIDRSKTKLNSSYKSRQ